MAFTSLWSIVQGTQSESETEVRGNQKYITSTTAFTIIISSKTVYQWRDGEMERWLEIMLQTITSGKEVEEGVPQQTSKHVAVIKNYIKGLSPGPKLPLPL